MEGKKQRTWRKTLEARTRNDTRPNRTQDKLAGDEFSLHCVITALHYGKHSNRMIILTQKERRAVELIEQL